MNANVKLGLEEYNRKLASGEIERTPPKNPIQKWKENPTKIRMSVNAYCVDCSGGVEEANWMNRVRYCQILGCPLHQVRPYSKGISNKQCLAWREVD